jgi:hypothetical protein
LRRGARTSQESQQNSGQINGDGNLRSSSHDGILSPRSLDSSQ